MTNICPLNICLVTAFRWPVFPYYGLCSPDKLMNVTEFPIGISYGDRDHFGSEGADLIIKSNKFFKTGEA